MPKNCIGLMLIRVLNKKFKFLHDGIDGLAILIGFCI